jgi:UDP-N-acetylglucosamine--N-acetylmuramyl-(pentapeptide) pyrophosphoryl-undecaprenol N-acetylglucosamine transferase
LAKILYGVSSIGFGHAARSAAIGLKLRERGLEPVFATGGNVVQFLESYGFKVHDVVAEPTPWERNGEMRYPALWYARYWLGYRSTKRRMESLIDELRPEVITGDEEFSCISVAIERQISHAMISDELELGFARGRLSRYVEKRAGAWYTDLQHRTSSLLVPDFGEDYENVHFMSPAVRAVTRSREQVMTDLAMGPGAQMILYSASGSGIGGFIFDRLIRAIEMLSPPGVVLVVTGLSEGPERPWVRYLGVQRDNQDFVAAADLVVSTAGKSTIDEAASYGSPLIAIPIKNHSEQEKNAAALGFSSEDLYHLDRLVPRYLGRRTRPLNYHGADSIAGYLQGLL